MSCSRARFGSKNKIAHPLGTVSNEMIPQNSKKNLAEKSF